MKPIYWISSSLEDLKRLDQLVQETFGYALFLAQEGDKHISTKPLKGFSGAGVLEIIENYKGDTFRAVYTIRFSQAVYVLHVFQKKSKKGIKTPKQEIELIKTRLRAAQQHYEEKYGR